jgi:hypothetical protein
MILDPEPPAVIIIVMILTLQKRKKSILGQITVSREKKKFKYHGCFQPLWQLAHRSKYALFRRIGDKIATGSINDIVTLRYLFDTLHFVCVFFSWK